MANNKKSEDISDKLRIGFDRARLKFLQKKAQENGYVIVSDAKGNVIRVPARDLLAKTLQSQSK